MRISFRDIDPLNTSFLLAVHVISLATVVLHATGTLVWSWATVALAAVWLLCTSVSITGGYHRLFAHRTYRCHPALQAFYLLFGAASFQNSALKWSADHRRHHASTDTEADPYNIRRGFLWAHVLWLLARRPRADFGGAGARNVQDLVANPLVMFQHRHYFLIGAVMAFGVPTAIALAWSDPLGAFLLAGWVRLLLQYHATFSVNSLAHTLGRQPYSSNDSSRDSAITALVTLGEGYHNFHHTFPGDYRNGVRLHQFDPTKWFVHALSWVGVTWDLRRAPVEAILRERLRMDTQVLLGCLQAAGPAVASAWSEHARVARERIESLHHRWQETRQQYQQARELLGHRAADQIRQMRADLRQARADFKSAYRAWCGWLRQPELLRAEI